MKHFAGMIIPVVPDHRRIDVSDENLLAVLEEQEGDGVGEPSVVVTRLGIIASGGGVSGGFSLLPTLRVRTES